MTNSISGSIDFPSIGNISDIASKAFFATPDQRELTYLIIHETLRESFLGSHYTITELWNKIDLNVLHASNYFSQSSETKSSMH